jgi:Flp pilus assembly protein TadD
MWVTLPLVLLLLDWWPLRRWRPAGMAAEFKAASLGRLLLEKLPLLALSVLMSAVTFLVQQHGESVKTLADIPLAQRLGNAVVSYGAYLGQSLWPVDLAAFYPRPRGGLAAGPLILSGLVLAAVTVLALREGRRRPYLAVGWLWYLGMLVPVIGLVQVGEQARADRYTYVPLIGIFVLLVWGLAEIAQRWQIERAAALTAAVVLAGLGLASWIQTQYWTNSVMLWEHTLEVAGSSWLAHVDLGVALRDRGNLEGARTHLLAARALQPGHWLPSLDLGVMLGEQGRPREAIEYLNEAARIRPQDPDVQRNLGLVLRDLGRRQEAIACFHKALDLGADDALLHNALGLSLQESGQLDDAIAQFQDACQLEPTAAKFHANLALALFQRGRPADAEAPLREAIGLDPHLAAAHYLLGLCAQLRHDWPQAEAAFRHTADLEPPNARAQSGLAYALAQQGRPQEAAAHYQQSLQLDRSWPAAVLRTVWTLAADPDAGKRQGALAVQEAQKAIEALGGADPTALDALAAAYAETGRFGDAVATARRAAALADSTGKSSLAEAIRSRLALYEKGNPFRGAPP